MLLYFLINYFKILRLEIIKHCATLIFAKSGEILTQDSKNLLKQLSKPVTKRQKNISYSFLSTPGIYENDNLRKQF